MFIYIDESGNFTQPSQSTHAYSCVGALTIPSRYHGQVLKSFNRLKRQWHCNGKEPKGKDLQEKQIASVIELLLAGKSKFHICATDMYFNTPDSIQAFKIIQADRLLANITDQHQPTLIKQTKDFNLKMKALSNQLFVQLYMMIVLISKHLQDAVIHYALSDPAELGEFRWTVDRKGTTKTTYEDLWISLLSPFIQSRQFSSDPNDRIFCVSEGDYSYFEKFCDRISKWPEHLPARRNKTESANGINVIRLSRILNDSFALGDSAVTPGLQLADIVTNAFKRAISGRLQESGWQDLGRLMFRWKENSARLVYFGDSMYQPVLDDHCANVLMEMTRFAASPLDS